LSWYTFDGGGAMFTAGGDFELAGTIGQPDAGMPISGGSFELSGGFWPGADAAQPCDPCDANCDGAVDAFDVEPFISVLLGGAGCAPCTGDVNGDGVIDAFDIEPFIDILVNGGPGCSPCAADADGNGVVDAFDIEPFISCLVGP
jgi:hypothetical protein